MCTPSCEFGAHTDSPEAIGLGRIGQYCGRFVQAEEEEERGR